MARNAAQLFSILPTSLDRVSESTASSSACPGKMLQRVMPTNLSKGSRHQMTRKRSERRQGVLCLVSSLLRLNLVKTLDPGVATAAAAAVSAQESPSVVGVQRDAQQHACKVPCTRDKYREARAARDVKFLVEASRGRRPGYRRQPSWMAGPKVRARSTTNTMLTVSEVACVYQKMQPDTATGRLESQVRF